VHPEGKTLDEKLRERGAEIKFPLPLGSSLSSDFV
jgi:hypothetical protein